jgi:hypothetical protein
MSLLAFRRGASVRDDGPAARPSWPGHAPQGRDLATLRAARIRARSRGAPGAAPAAHALRRRPALWLGWLVAALAAPAWGQAGAFAQGDRVVARPSAQWEACTVNQAMPESRAYRVQCRTGEYVVPASSVQAPTPQALALTEPPSAAPGMPKVGDAVLASPLGLDSDWRPCVVTQDLSHQDCRAQRRDT